MSSTYALTRTCLLTPTPDTIFLSMKSNTPSHSRELHIPKADKCSALDFLRLPRGIVDLDMANTNWQADAQQVVLIMVGLPARGKSLISGKGMLHLRSNSIQSC